MQFLKQKAIQAYQYSKDLIRKPRSTASGQALLLSLLSHPRQESDPAALQRLAALSAEFHQYTEIFNGLIEKLQEFSYSAGSIEQTLRVLNVTVFLVRSGSQEFAGDFRKNEDLLATLEAVDTHRFENCMGLRDAKTLTYRLELIRHRAAFLRKLVNSSELREAERARHAMHLSVLEEFKEKAEGDETINGLRIDASFDKPRSRSMREKENKSVEVVSLPAGKEGDWQLVSKPGAGRAAALGNKISNQLCA